MNRMRSENREEIVLRRYYQLPYIVRYWSFDRLRRSVMLGRGRKPLAAYPIALSMISFVLTFWIISLLRATFFVLLMLPSLFHVNKICPSYFPSNSDKYLGSPPRNCSPGARFWSLLPICNFGNRWIVRVLGRGCEDFVAWIGLAKPCRRVTDNLWHIEGFNSMKSLGSFVALQIYGGIMSYLFAMSRIECCWLCKCD